MNWTFETVGAFIFGTLAGVGLVLVFSVDDPGILLQVCYCAISEGDMIWTPSAICPVAGMTCPIAP